MKSRKQRPQNAHSPKNKLQGILSVTMRGAGFLARPGEEEDIYITPENLNTGLHMDTVEVRMLPERDKGRMTGVVSKVIERAKVEFVGTLEHQKERWFVKPDDKRMYRSILLTEKPGEKLEPETKVLVRMNEWSDPRQHPEGKLLRIIGQKGEHETEMQAIVLGRGFSLDFNAALLSEAVELERNKKITPQEIAKRRDFREIPTCTIDPEDAKDFDDALSYQRLENGDIEVGVHIADVSHYVRPGSAIDREARERGTSIYLVDRTIPMLPEVLSNDICSLNPNEDKLTYAAVFILSPEGDVKERWFGKTIIHSDKRFSYEEAQRVIDSKEGPLAEALLHLNTLAKKIREERFKHGAIDFDQAEIRFKLDDKGKPVEVVRKERLDAHKLIEEFMLLANREVATYVAKLGKNNPDMQRAFVYRIHDIPDPERIEELGIFIRALGYEFKTNKGIVTAKELNRLFKEIEGKPEETLIKTATIRSMAKAIYSTKNVGHFGLAFQYYTHFTSPIRRYPDVMVHRMLKKHLDSEPLSPNELKTYERLALQSSQREVSAVEAERDSIKLKQVEYMSEHVGEIFDGVISGVTEWGIYVEEKKTLAEGMVRLSSLKDDFYDLDKKTYSLVGQKTKRRFRLGDPVKVCLIGASKEDRTLEWELISLSAETL